MWNKYIPEFVPNLILDYIDNWLTDGRTLLDVKLLSRLKISLQIQIICLDGINLMQGEIDQ